jgi:DnaK suppressor protein
VAKKSSKKKKLTKRKTTSKKKVAARATSAAGKKKTPSRKRTPTAAKKTKSRKKSASKKKTSSKKTSSKKKTSAKRKTASTTRTAKTAPAKKTAAEKPVTKKTPAKKAAAPRRKSQPRSRALGAQSVAQAASAAKADAEGYVIINGRRVRMISTKGQALPRKNRSAVKAEADAPEPEAEAKPTKTYLTAKELRYYRDLLLVKRAELVGDLSAMEAAALEARAGNISHLPIHMADIGTDTYDQDFMLGLAQTERQRLMEIDDALRRIAEKTYGICQMTGNPIPKARLNAKPWAKYTIEAARALEGQWGG